MVLEATKGQAQGELISECLPLFRLKAGLMPPDKSLEVQLAVLAEQYNHIKQELKEAKEARKLQYETAEKQSNTLTQMDIRMKAVEDSLKQQAPTIEEFITIKHKVVGAGMAGRWAWVVLCALVGLLFSFRTEIFKWLAKS